MAIYHYHRNIGKRAQGKNAVFAVAYIRGEKRTCDKTSVTRDFSNKPDVVYTHTFIPEDAPQWAKDLRHASVSDSLGKKHDDITGELFSTYAWNQIEFIENRVDSQLYFHDDIALPNALNKEQAIELVNDFVQSSLAVNGVFCDVAIHWDNDNHHFHVVMPLRTLTDDGFSKKLRFTKAQLANEVTRVREAWAMAANRHLQTLGIDDRIDHRNYKEQGIDLTPTVKVGKFNHLTNSDAFLRKQQENEMIRNLNSRAIQAHPEILSAKILKEHPSFDSQIIADEINRQVILEQLDEAPSLSEYVVDPTLDNILKSIQGEDGIFNERALKNKVLEQVDSGTEFDRIYNAILSHESIYALGLGEDGRQHFVGRAAFDLEKKLLNATHHLSKEHTFNVSKRLVHRVAGEFNLNDAQRRALLHLTRSGNVSIVCGYAGTGKTYMLKAAKAVWDQSGFTVIGMSTSGKAASGLETETGITSHTIYKFLNAVKKEHITIDNKTILVMDEMGMTSLDDMQAVVEIARVRGAKFMGVGDIEQTQPVGRGAPQRAMVDDVGAVFLDTIIRQKSAWQREATTLFETNKTAEGFALYEEQGCVHLHDTYAIAMEKTVEAWYAAYHLEKDTIPHGVVMTAFKNETVDALNVMARETLVSAGLLLPGMAVSSADGVLHIAVGERLLLTKNDYNLNVKNGDVATVIALSNETRTLSIQLDNGRTIDFKPDDYKHFKYGYAATVHKLQGYTGKDVNVLIDGEGWDRHKFLVAATRHTSRLAIHASKETFSTIEQLKESVSRHGLNDILTDFPVAYSTRRGFDQHRSAKVASGIIQKQKTSVYDAMGYLFNYQAAIEQGESAYTLHEKDIEKRRKDAVLVAEFSDNRVEVAVKLGSLSESPDTEKALIQKDVYALQLRNGDIATTILSNLPQYAIALERNRLGIEKIKAAARFHERHRFVQSLVDAHRLSQFSNAQAAYALVNGIKAHYGHIVHIIDESDARHAFMRDMEHMADRHRRDTALALFGMENRALINTAVRYKALDYEVGTRLKTLDKANDEDKKDLYEINADRDKLAAELMTSLHVDAVTAHFAIKHERIASHAQKYQDRLFVQSFSTQTASTKIQGNLVKQSAAHRIKGAPKQFGIYIDEFLTDGWKSINLENWLYERRLTIANASPEFRKSLQCVQRYKVAASSAYLQWQKAIERSKKQSPHKNKGFKQAQGLSWKRSLQAHEIIKNLKQHVAALSFEKVDTTKLYQQAIHVEYLVRYRAETRETLKLRMAHHIHRNLKDFQAGLAVYGLYQDVKERAAHFAYLQRVKEAPTQEIKSLIRLALDYQEKKIEAGTVFRQVKTLEQLNIDTRGLSLQAKQLMAQRNEAAYTLLQVCEQHALLTKEITGINLDAAKLQREAKQHISYKTVMHYLSAPPEARGALAKEMLTNKSGWTKPLRGNFPRIRSHPLINLLYSL